MAKNAHLILARKLKRDEFYTCRSTVEDELWHYEKHFKGKTNLCNCDDDEHSEFFKYFYKRFDVLGLKKLIGVHYQQEKDKPSYKLELYKDTNNDGVVDYKDKIIKTLIYGNEEYNAGDFRSPECIELLKEADIVVTNPPFSLLREFIAQLMEYNKKFLIIGNANAIGCKELFPLFKDNKIWLGISIHSGDRKFRLKSYVDPIEFDENGDEYVKVSGVRWFTNLKITKRNKPLMLEGSYYTPEKYPKYDNYDAINVDKVADIPCDYPGVMGVPLTFMDKYCPEQFRIVGLAKRGGDPKLKIKIYTKEDNEDYSNLNAGPTVFRNSKLVVLYSRILIKNKHPQKSEERKKVNKIFTLPEGFLADCALVLEKKVA